MAHENSIHGLYGGNTDRVSGENDRLANDVRALPPPSALYNETRLLMSLVVTSLCRDTEQIVMIGLHQTGFGDHLRICITGTWTALAVQVPVRRMFTSLSQSAP
jgi:hypothetical protein